MDETLDQAPAVELSVDQRMEALLEGPDDGEPEGELEGEDAPTEEPEQAEEGEETEAAADESEPEEAPEPVEEIEWNGETKKLTKTELKELAQKGFDYTQKTQQLAEQRRQLDASVEQAKQSIALQNEQIETIATLKALDTQLDQFKGVNWHQLAESDPVQYLKLNQTFRDLKETRDGHLRTFHERGAQIQESSRRQAEEKLAAEQAALAKLPEFQGDKAAKTQAQVRAYLQEAGFTAQEVDSIADHRLVKIALEAAKYRDLQKSAPAKKVADVPKVLKPGATRPKADTSAINDRKALKNTGRQEYAAKLIERML